MATDDEQKHDDEREYWSGVFQHMSDECNGGDEEAMPEAFAEHMMTEHRTLQQDMVRVMIACLIKYAEEYDVNYHGMTDLRNEEAVKFCNALRNKPPYFPYI